MAHASLEGTRRSVFIAYSHCDRQWLVRLRVFLSPQVRQDQLEIWDDTRIPVGASWHDEIKAALVRARVAVLLVTPDFLASDFIQEVEVPSILEAAAAGHLTVFCVPISTSSLAGSPLLKFQWANHNKPLDLLSKAKRHRALVEISDAIRDFVSVEVVPDGVKQETKASFLDRSDTISPREVPVGALYGVPQVPPHFVPRVEQETARALLLTRKDDPVGITGLKTEVGVYGHSGIGKTVIAAMVARDADVRSTFVDGIYWVDAGERATPPEALARLFHLTSLPIPRGIDLSEERVRREFIGKKCLVVLDDVWDVGLINAFRALPPTCKLLFTTRDSTLIGTSGASDVRVATLTNDEAITLVESWSGQPFPRDSEDAQRVITWCGGLPIALAITGAEVRHGMAWHDLRRISTRTADTYARHPYASAFISIERSLRSLTADETQRFTELVVLPEGVNVPQRAILRLWRGALPEIEASRLLTKLQDKSLVNVFDDRIRLHDLVREYLRLTCDDLSALHMHLLDSFGYSFGDPGNFLNDPYLLRHLAYHLTESGHRDVAARLLKNFPYVAAKIHNNLLRWLLLEYESAAGQRDRPKYDEFVNNVMQVVSDLDRAHATGAVRLKP
jgi:hypothetical protein